MKSTTNDMVKKLKESKRAFVQADNLDDVPPKEEKGKVEKPKKRKEKK